MTRLGSTSGVAYSYLTGRQMIGNESITWNVADIPSLSAFRTGDRLYTEVGWSTQRPPGIASGEILRRDFIDTPTSAATDLSVQFATLAALSLLVVFV